MRPDLEIIQKWIEPESRVLDLGCGDGALLTFLEASKKVKGIGLEIDTSNIQHCVENGINVIEQNLDNGLSNFETNSFDTVLLTQTLQALSKPDKLLDEMLRIGKRGIVTFPNFGNWKIRAYLASKGKMPIFKFMPYQWYDTPNIHFCTVKDFDELCLSKGIEVITRMVVDSKHKKGLGVGVLPNLLGETAIYHLTRNKTEK